MFLQHFLQYCLGHILCCVYEVCQLLLMTETETCILNKMDATQFVPHPFLVSQHKVQCVTDSHKVCFILYSQ